MNRSLGRAEPNKPPERPTDCPTAPFRRHCCEYTFAESGSDPPEIGVTPQIDLKRTAQEVKVIYIVGAKIALERGENGVQRDIQRLGLFPVNIHVELWYLRTVGRKDPGQAGLGVSSGHNRIGSLQQRIQSRIASILYFELESPSVS